MSRILIVEDEELLREIYSEYLEKKGYDVKTAENGQKALDFLSDDNRPDLILLDLNMPEINGKEFLKTMLANKKFKNIPVFLLTGISNYKEIGETLNLGAKGYIEKTDSLGEVLNKIDMVIPSYINLNETNKRGYAPRKSENRNLDI